MNLLRVGRPGCLNAQAALDLALGLLQLVQQVGTDGEQVAAGAMDDLTDLSQIVVPWPSGCDSIG